MQRLSTYFKSLGFILLADAILVKPQLFPPIAQLEMNWRAWHNSPRAKPKYPEVILRLEKE